MFTVAGGDATNIFEDIGHSSDAKKELKEHHIGILKLSEKEQRKLKEAADMNANVLGSGVVGFSPTIFIVFLAIATGLYYLWAR